MFRKYGTEYVLQNDEIKNKIKNTNLLKYSVTSPIQNDEIKIKLKIQIQKNMGLIIPVNLTK